jgi:exonuclease III
MASFDSLSVKSCNLSPASSNFRVGVSSVKSKSLHIVSYNMHGFNQGSVFLENLCNIIKPDFICIQEHWLTSIKMNQILNYSKLYCGFGVSAMDRVISQSILRGRPSGGVAVLVNNDFNSKVKCLKNAEKFVIVRFDNIILVNVYLPCSAVANYINVVLEILTDVRFVLEEHRGCNIIFCGDLNSNLYVVSPGSTLIKSFMSDYGLIICNDVLPTICDYTYHHETLKHKSYIDFFLVSTGMVDFIIGHSVLDEEINLSDHMPISLKVCLKSADIILSVPEANSNIRCKQASSKSFRWDHANLADYYMASYNMLLPILSDLDCMHFDHGNAHCYDQAFQEVNKAAAIELIETVYSKIILGLNNAALQTVPRIESNFLKFWWDQELNVAKDKAIASNINWIAAGKPNSGIIFDERKKDKYAYRNCIRQKKKKEYSDISNSLHESLLGKDQDNFWKTWKKKFGNKQSLPKFINGNSNETKISEEFAQSFAEACNFNSDSRNSQLCSEFLKLKESIYKFQRFDSMPSVTVESIDTIISKLKFGKAASVDNITAEHIKYCHPIIVSVLNKLFNLMLHYDYVPNDFGKSLTVPIPKNIASSCSITDDYRGITISPVISKIFEHSLLLYYGDFLTSSDFQFGFKKDSSCSHAVYSVRKSVEYFIERDSTVSVCAIDLSKAFDKVNKYALFIKLLKRKCPLKFIILLDNWYDKCFTCVKWGSSFSNYVKLNAGVRQGGILSPALFAVYVNDVLLLLGKSKLGCHINQYCCNSFMYADDLLLLSLSICDLQKMIDICKTELDWLDMKINIKKSSLLRIGKRCKIPIGDILISGTPITIATEIRYLGVYFESATSFKCNMHHAKVKYFRSLNAILGKIGSFSSVDVMLSLVSSFANPVLLYCLETGCLNSSELSKLNYPFRSIYVKLFSTFDTNIIEQCQYYTWQLPVKMLVHLRCLLFFRRLEKSSSPASTLFKMFGAREQNSISLLYGINKGDNPLALKKRSGLPLKFH